MGQTIGYARVSAADQNPQMQLDALRAAGCDKIFVEKASGALRERPELGRALEYIRDGDVLVVWKLDRLGRSSQHLTEIVIGLRERGIDFRSLNEHLDTTTPTGMFIFQVFAGLAEMERAIIRERAAAGRAAARARGATGGRPRLLDDDQTAAARALLATKRTVAAVARSFNVSEATLRRALARPVPSELSDDASSAGEVSEASFARPGWLPGTPELRPLQK